MAWMLEPLLLVSFVLAATGQEGPQPVFRFRCNDGYNVSACDDQVQRLRAVLSTLDATGLGEWTWILVRSEDWKPILHRVSRDPDSPAFTILEKHQTFLEEALFDFRAAPRSRSLLEKWRLPLDQLLEFAVSHELGHALCHETNERLTAAYAEQLRVTSRVTCRATAAATSADANEGAIRRAVALLPRHARTVVVMNADEASPNVRQMLVKLDAFTIRGGTVVYVVKQSPVLAGASRGSTLYVCMLASIIWHEVAHLDGADERAARRAEEQLWTRFVRDAMVDNITGLRYLEALTRRPVDQLMASRDLR